MSQPFRLRSLLTLLMVVACSDKSPRPNDPTPPPTPVGRWVAAAIEAAALPAVAYEGPLFDDGGPARFRLLLDSSHVTLLESGRYERIDWTTEQQNMDPGAGAPWQNVLPSQLNDFGSWSRASTGLNFESGFFQNLRFTATHDSSTDLLDVFTGIDLDPLRRTVRYRRR